MSRLKTLSKLIILGLISISTYSFAAPTPKTAASCKQTDQSRVCFAPEDNCISAIVNQISNAKKTIAVQADQFTSLSIANALVAAKKRGATVTVLLDKVNVNDKNSVVSLLEKNHIKFLIDAKPQTTYNKVIIIDGQEVLTGNFNFVDPVQNETDAGNVLTIKDPQVVSLYQGNFDKRRQQSISLAAYCQSSAKCQLESVAHKAATATSKAASNAWQSTKEFWHKHVN